MSHSNHRCIRFLNTNISNEKWCWTWLWPQFLYQNIQRFNASKLQLATDQLVTAHIVYHNATLSASLLHIHSKSVCVYISIVVHARLSLSFSTCHFEQSAYVSASFGPWSWPRRLHRLLTIIYSLTCMSNFWTIVANIAWCFCVMVKRTIMQQITIPDGMTLNWRWKVSGDHSLQIRRVHILIKWFPSISRRHWTN